MKNHKEIMTAKHRARLARLPVNSGHARVLRAKLGISPVVDAPVVEEVKPMASKEKKASKKKSEK